MRQFVVPHLNTQVREPQVTVVIVELQRADAGRVGQKGQDDDVAHQFHVLGKILRNPIGRTGNVRFFERRSPTLQFALLSRPVDLTLHLANRVEVLVELALI